MPHSFYVAVHVCAWKVKFTMASFKLESPFHSNEMLVSSYTGKSQGTVNIGTPWEIWDPWFSYSQESGDPGPYITNRMKTQGPHFTRNMGIPL